jgi:hypothetical protein
LSTLLPALAALGLCVLSAPAEGQVPVLVELFTSEGCSSCPPADALLARLAEEPPKGVRVIALSEHVDYWDGGGWRDRFSSGAFTRRQEAYARRLGIRGPYTPQLLVAGRLDVLGSDGRAARAAIAASAREPQGRLEAHLEAAGEGLYLVVKASWEAGAPADVLLARVEDRASSKVTGGENAGRALEHVAVARALSSLGSGAGRFSGRAKVERAGGPGPSHLVVFVQERASGRVWAAAELALPL